MTADVSQVQCYSYSLKGYLNLFPRSNFKLHGRRPKLAQLPISSLINYGQYVRVINRAPRSWLLRTETRAKGTTLHGADTSSMAYYTPYQNLAKDLLEYTFVSKRENSGSWLQRVDIISVTGDVMSIDEAELHFVMASYSVTHHFIIVHLHINFLYFFWKVRTEHQSAFEIWN